jgi:hypothetical protein
VVQAEPWKRCLMIIPWPDECPVLKRSWSFISQPQGQTVSRILDMCMLWLQAVERQLRELSARCML